MKIMKSPITNVLFLIAVLTWASPALAAKAEIFCDACSSNVMRSAAESKALGLGDGTHRIEVGDSIYGQHRVYRVVVSGFEVGSTEKSSTQSEKDQWNFFLAAAKPPGLIYDIPQEVAPLGHATEGVFALTSAYLRQHPHYNSLLVNVWLRIFGPIRVKVRWSDGYTAEFKFQTHYSLGAAFTYIEGTMRDPEGNQVDWKPGPDASPYNGGSGSEAHISPLQDWLNDTFTYGVPVYIVDSINLPSGVSGTWTCTADKCTLTVKK